MSRSLLVHADSPLSRTPFGDVARGLGEAAAARDWQVVQVAMRNPDPLKKHPRIEILDARLDATAPDTGLGLLRRLYGEHDFSALVLINDIETASPWASDLRVLATQRRVSGRPKTPIVNVFPVDGQFVGDAAMIMAADRNVTYTEWGREQLPWGLPPNVTEAVEVVPPGYWNYQLPPFDREAARASFFQVYDDDVFVVVSSMTDLRLGNAFGALATIKALRERGRVPRPLLYVHAPTRADELDLRVMQYALRLIPKRDILLASEERWSWPAPKVQELYRAADVFLDMSRRCAWPVRAVEAAASGCPVVAPSFGPFKQCFDAEDLFCAGAWSWDAGDNRGVAFSPDPEVAAGALEQLYAERQESGLSERGAKAQARARELSWGVLGPKWLRVLEEAMSP